jgi:hypothetical protein
MVVSPEFPMDLRKIVLDKSLNGNRKQEFIGRELEDSGPLPPGLGPRCSLRKKVAF